MQANNARKISVSKTEKNELVTMPKLSDNSDRCKYFKEV
jgi:hypothetical protein